MFHLQYVVICNTILIVLAYRNKLYTINPQKTREEFLEQCKEIIIPARDVTTKANASAASIAQQQKTPPMVLKYEDRTEIDPLLRFEEDIHRLVFGAEVDGLEEERRRTQQYYKKMANEHIDPLFQYPTGYHIRHSLFNNKTTVSLPRKELLQQGHCHLRITLDFMQTAVNAFSIFLYGDLADVLGLPADYVLRSARTIAMMKLPREKLMATWDIVKKGEDPVNISITTLELYRPLFKYVPGREMARLNLTNDRILLYIGTHAEINRHQVGLVASRYISLNPRWMQSRYLNLMNNILCGIPMVAMRRIKHNDYLQLSYQTFYNIRACDPLQRKFFLNMMANTQTLGKSSSWTALDVSRLGYLLIEVSGPVLATVNPPAMAGITSQVMRQMPEQSLRFITEMQLRYIEQRPLNILVKKLISYQEFKFEISISYRHVTKRLLIIVCILIKMFT